MDKTTTDEPDKATFAKWAAFLLDDLIKLPGTKKRIGLDPIIGAIPGIGDVTTSTLGLSLLATSAKKNVPRSVYLRMAANWTLNSLIGAIPIIGDIFSFWYKSNQRNHALLRAHLDDTHGEEAESQGWTPLFILLGLAAIVLTAIGFVAIWAAKTLWSS